MGYKECTKCSLTKPLDDFFADKRIKSGKQAKCKECDNQARRAYRLKNLEKERAKDVIRNKNPVRAEAKRAFNTSDRGIAKRKAWFKSEQGKSKVKDWRQSERGKESYKHAVRKWRKENPIKYKATKEVCAAVRSGKLVRPNVCSKCMESNGIIQAHHPDYSKIFDVIWLCYECHKDWHKENGPGVNG